MAALLQLVLPSRWFLTREARLRVPLCLHKALLCLPAEPGSSDPAVFSCHVNINQDQLLAVVVDQDQLLAVFVDQDQLLTMLVTRRLPPKQRWS